MVEIYTNNSENITLPESDFSQELQNLKDGVESLEENEKLMKSMESLSQSILRNMLPIDAEMMQHPGDINDLFTRIDIHKDIFNKQWYKKLALLSVLLSFDDKHFDLNDISDADFISMLFAHLPERISEFQKKCGIKDTWGVIDYVTLYQLMTKTHTKLYTEESYKKIMTWYTDHGRYVLNKQWSYDIDEEKKIAYKWSGPRQWQYFHADGWQYNGEMIGSIIEWRGRYTFPNWDSLEGEWQNNTIFGKISYRRKNGDVYKGYSRGGVMGVPAWFTDKESIGYGTYIFADGRSFSGLFENNSIKEQPISRLKDTTSWSVKIHIPQMQQPQALPLKTTTPAIAQSSQ